MGDFDERLADVQAGDSIVAELGEFNGEVSRPGGDFQDVGIGRKLFRDLASQRFEVFEGFPGKIRVPLGDESFHPETSLGLGGCECERGHKSVLSLAIITPSCGGFDDESANAGWKPAGYANEDFGERDLDRRTQRQPSQKPAWRKRVPTTMNSPQSAGRLTLSIPKRYHAPGKAVHAVMSVN